MKNDLTAQGILEAIIQLADRCRDISEFGLQTAEILKDNDKISEAVYKNLTKD